MRDILFRGKRIDNGEWVEGYYLQFHDMHIIIPFEAKDSEHFYLFDFALEVIPETVGQYTGLTDKNGKKIFEGDIVLDKYDCEKFGFVGAVSYDFERSSYEIKSFKYPEYIANLGSRINSVRIIGNIFDNPKLLKGGEQT